MQLRILANAGAPYYGVATAAESVAGIGAPLLCNLAEHDEPRRSSELTHSLLTEWTQ